MLYEGVSCKYQYLHCMFQQAILPHLWVTSVAHVLLPLPAPATQAPTTLRAAVLTADSMAVAVLGLVNVQVGDLLSPTHLQTLGQIGLSAAIQQLELLISCSYGYERAIASVGWWRIQIY